MKGQPGALDVVRKGLLYAILHWTLSRQREHWRRSRVVGRIKVAAKSLKGSDTIARRRDIWPKIVTSHLGAISWCTKRKSTVSLSTTEVEYRAAAMGAQEITWLVQLLKDLHQPMEYSIPLYCDNQSEINLAENPVFHARTKRTLPCSSRKSS
ncbi:uncharacterized protein LOC107024553 [Solanum pennellii]|uniref:Uncharacterized protein LOC107024553 n=1 Tax=Solanum pennellii TaxID=28526 RepID=A0ABM1H6J1_SOLPN|nr:uncharacterized protein LOC107024553 [Solanum pennellii]